MDRAVVHAGGAETTSVTHNIIKNDTAMLCHFFNSGVHQLADENFEQQAAQLQRQLYIRKFCEQIWREYFFQKIKFMLCSFDCGGSGVFKARTLGGRV